MDLAVYAWDYLRLEAHIKHAIRFIEHQICHSSEVCCSALEMVNKATRGSNDNLHTVSS